MISSVQQMNTAFSKAETNFQKQIRRLQARTGWFALLSIILAVAASAACLSSPAAASEWGCMTAKKTAKPDLIDTYCYRQQPPPSKFRRSAGTNAVNSATASPMKVLPRRAG